MAEHVVGDPDVTVVMDAGEIGWVRFSLRVGPNAFDYDIGDLTDALGDLLRATLQIACGGYVAEAVFDLEPGDCFIRLERRAPPNSNTLAIRIWEERGAGEVELYRAESDPDSFGKAVILAAQSILAAGGEEAFRERWDFAFPVRALAALEAALSFPDQDHKLSATVRDDTHGALIYRAKDEH